MSAQAVRTWLRSRTRRLNSITAQASRAATRMAGSRMDVVTRGGPFREDADDTASRPGCFRTRALDLVGAASDASSSCCRLPCDKLAAEAAPAGSDAQASARSEERRVGKEWASTCRSRWARDT